MQEAAQSKKLAIEATNVDTKAKEVALAIMSADLRRCHVRTPILSHTDLACNTSYHFAASRTVFPRVPPYLARDRLRLLAHIYDSAASIHMTKNPG